MIKKIKENRKKIVIIGIIAVVALAIHFSGVADHLSLQNIKDNRDMIKSYAENNYIQSVSLFILVYIIAIGLSLPGATILTLTSGFLFGSVLGTIYVNIGATVGAAIVFLLARYFIGEWMQKKYSVQLKKFNDELEKNGVNYLLTLRLIPIFPFFLINIFAGITKIPLRKFIWTTSLGIIPGSFVYSYAGKQFGNLESLSGIFTKEIFIAFTLLGILALIPIIYKKVTNAKNKKEERKKP